MSFDVKNITYRYAENSKNILEDVSFSVQEGAVTAVVGPSGSGKTTLINILSGVIPTLMPDGVLTGSFDVAKNISVSVVSQTPENQLFGYGVEDAIAFGMENMGLDSETMHERMEYVLDLFNIQHLRNRSVAKLSGGQRQAVCIASVLAMQPDVLIMDEPVSSLDPNGKKLVQTILAQLRASGQTTIIVDNNLEWSAGIVEHVVGLKEGKVVFDGTKEEFFSDHEVQENLGVTLPQEVLIYHKIKHAFPGMNMFYNIPDARKEISRFVEKREREYTAEKEEIEPILTTENLKQTFADGFNALIDINSSFAKGKVTAILGQNGSGKTTLVKHLNGLIKPTSGRVLYLGNDIRGKSVAEISRDVILVFQHPEHMIFEQTVKDELSFCARAQGIGVDEAEIEKILKDYELFDEREELPANLSMGKKHVLTILSVLFSSADVIILDEPTLGMDWELKGKLEDIISYLIEKGKTVIMISHEFALVFKVCDRMLVLNNGVQRFEGSREELLADRAVFEDLNLPMPAVVQLSREFGFEKIACNLDDFLTEILKAAGKEQA